MSDSSGFETSVLHSSLSPQFPQTALVHLDKLPSTDVLEALGKAVFFFSLLEYYLKVIYKRAIPGASLPDILEQRGEDSLGGLINGVTNRGDDNFDGLLKIAKKNPLLALIRSQLVDAEALARVRKKYVHGGIACRTDGTWVFLKSGEETSEAHILSELAEARRKITSLIGHIQKTIPTPKS